MDRTFAFASFDIDAYLEVQNVTNRRNVEVAGYSDDFSRFEPVYGLPVLPVFGLKAVF